MGALKSVCSPSVVRSDPIADAEVSRFPFDTRPDAYCKHSGQWVHVCNSPGHSMGRMQIKMCACLDPHVTRPDGT
jgi:hypothetical protein